MCMVGGWRRELLCWSIVEGEGKGMEYVVRVVGNLVQSEHLLFFVGKESWWLIYIKLIGKQTKLTSTKQRYNNLFKVQI